MAGFFRRAFGPGRDATSSPPVDVDPALQHAIAERIYPVFGSIIDGSKARKAAVIALVNGHSEQVELNVGKMMSSFELAKSLHESKPVQGSGFDSPEQAEIDRLLDQCIARYMEAAEMTKRGIEAENEDTILSSETLAKEAEQIGDEINVYLRKLGFPVAD